MPLNKEHLFVEIKASSELGGWAMSEYAQEGYCA
jgi:hypothetical protein